MEEADKHGDIFVVRDPTTIPSRFLTRDRPMKMVRMDTKE